MNFFYLQYSSDSNNSVKSTTPLYVAGRGRLSSSLTVVSEYEIPLDPEWEFPRDRWADIMCCLVVRQVHL